MNNPLLQFNQLPQFKKIEPKWITPAVDTVLKQNGEQLTQLLKQKKYTWDNLMLPLETMEDQLNQLWSIVEHLNAVVNSEDLRATHHENLSKITAYETALSHNLRLYRSILSLKRSKAFKKYSVRQKKVINDYLKHFKLSGVHLAQKQKKQFGRLEEKHASLASKFSDNVLDATQAWFYHVKNKKQLKGLPRHIVDSARKMAREKNSAGWIFTLDFPIYYAVMIYAEDRNFREKMYEAYSTRASDKGPCAKQFDNADIMLALLKNRRQRARLLGFKNYNEYSLATKMARNPEQVFKFCWDLVERVKPIAKKELKILKQFAAAYEMSHHGGKRASSARGLKVKPWDMAYYSEKLRQEKFHISQETLRKYFQEDKVLTGLFKLVEKLFSIDVVEKRNTDVWHKDVRFFEIRDKQNRLRGQFYMDLYARENKRGGAWMADCRNRRRLSVRKVQLPVAYLSCNFKKPLSQKPSLLTHDEVVTLFHEFGHGLQHLLTMVDYSSISGTNGVEWDAVELPSQFLENFAWEEGVLTSISRHVKTGKPLPNKLMRRLIESKNFQTGLRTLRQLEFGLLDFTLHQTYGTKSFESVQKTVKAIRQAVTVMPVPAYNRFPNSFTHIFGGGYAAGYYSYLWAEVLSSDAYSKFEEEGLFNPKIGASFLKYILEPGGSELALTQFKKFRGRAPKIDALLRHLGVQ